MMLLRGGRQDGCLKRKASAFRRLPCDGRAALESAEKQLRLLTTVPIVQGALLPVLFFIDYDARQHADVCEFFLKKDDARDFARERGNLPMWSIDKFSGTGDNAGAKYFVVESYDSFYRLYSEHDRPAYGGPDVARDDCWRRYDTLLRGDQQRAMCLEEGFKVLPFAYEVQMEGVPLHLYFDIEGSRVTNPHVNFEELMTFALQEFQTFIYSTMQVPRELLTQVVLVILDSSTDRKFSKHIVYKIPQCAFTNNYVCGALMNAFQHHIDSKFGDPQSGNNKFYIQPFGEAKDQQQLVPFIDFAVYTKFRDFRLLGSCKRKGCILPSTQLRWLWIDGSPNQMTKEVWLQCLCQNVDYSSVRYEIANIYDLRQPDGVPRSSSLRTAAPLNGFRTIAGAGAGVPVRQTTDSITIATTTTTTTTAAAGLPSHAVRKLTEIGRDIAKWIVSNAAFRDYFPSGSSKRIQVEAPKLYQGNWTLRLRCYTRYCRIKARTVGSEIAVSHTSNCIFFEIGLNGFTSNGNHRLGSLTQKCWSQQHACRGKSEWESLRDMLPQRFKYQIGCVLEPIFGGEQPAPVQTTTTNCMFFDDEEIE